MPKIDVNGVGIHYEEEGDGPPLLLISGLGANKLSWALVVPHLREHFRCITFDNRGTGQSDVPPGPYTMDQMGDDAAGLLDALGIESAAAIGWSLGGSVLQSMLINHGEKLNRAILLSTLPSYTDIQHGWLDALLTLRRADVDPLVLGIIGMPWGMTGRLISDHDKAFAQAQLALANPYPTSLEGYEAQAQAIREYDSRPQLPGVTTPTLVLVGAEDILTPVHQSVEIAELIPGAKLTVLPRGGHGVIVEYLDDALPHVLSFLQD